VSGSFVFPVIARCAFRGLRGDKKFHRTPDVPLAGRDAHPACIRPWKAWSGTARTALKRPKPR